MVMSKGNPTLAEFLAGFQILVPQRQSGRLVSYRYSVVMQRFLFRETGKGGVQQSKKVYTVADATRVYEEITPKQRPTVCR